MHTNPCNSLKYSILDIIRFLHWQCNDHSLFMAEFEPDSNPVGNGTFIFKKSYHKLILWLWE